MKHFIIGTAGHVDHGKSALIKALTGIDPDRLPEEKERGLTLDLGFANIKLPSGIECGIVDVPGHERYLKNMLAGVGGYDFALLVVDAGEGVMAQTREHLEIMQLLDIKDGMTVITKIDRVEPDMVDIVEEELIELLSDTFLHDSPVARVSTVTGEGIQSLIYLMDQRISRLEPRSVNDPLRLPIDRVFTKAGFGTIVTGTILQGKVETGDKILLLPSGTMSKVRQIQVHNDMVDRAYAGQRAALNVAWVDATTLFRGDQAVAPGSARATGRMDAFVNVLKSSPHPLENRSEVRLYTGTSEVYAKVILLDRDVLNQGEECFAQIVFEESVSVFPGDRFILRSPSVIFTIGGGSVLEPYPLKHRRFDKKIIELLEIKKKGDPVAVLEKIMNQEPYNLHSIDSMAGVLSLSLGEVQELIGSMKKDNRIHELVGGRFILVSILDNLEMELLKVIKNFEESRTNYLGTKPDEIRMNLPKMEDRLFRELMIHLKNKKQITENNSLLSTPSFIPVLDEEHQKCLRQLRQEFDNKKFTPPTETEIIKKFDFPPKVVSKVVEYMLFKGEMVKINDSILFLDKHLVEARKKIGRFIIENEGITPSDARSVLDTTRKYVIPLLEYFDRTYFTTRKDDKRILLRKNILIG